MAHGVDSWCNRRTSESCLEDRRGGLAGEEGAPTSRRLCRALDTQRRRRAPPTDLRRSVSARTSTIGRVASTVPAGGGRKFHQGIDAGHRQLRGATERDSGTRDARRPTVLMPRASCAPRTAVVWGTRAAGAPLGKRATGSPRDRHPRRQVDTRIIACGGLSSAPMVSRTGTVVALLNVRPPWMLE